MPFSPRIREIVHKEHVCGEIRAPGPTIGPGAFFVAGSSVFNLEEEQMDNRQLAYEKQTLLAVKDWDVFWNVLRFWSKQVRASTTPVGATGLKKA